MGSGVSDSYMYVFTCDTCRNELGPLLLKAGLKSYQASSPMEKVHLDFLGPLPRTEAGNEYILMMVDSFTKWVQCVPLPSQTAEMTGPVAPAPEVDPISQSTVLRSACARKFAYQV